MVDEVAHAVREEVVQDRYDHCLIGIDREVRDTPSCPVTGAEGDLVTFCYTCFFKDNMETLDRAGHLAVSEGFSSDII